MHCVQGEFGASPRSLAVPLVLADYDALSSACEACEAEALFSAEPLTRCNALAGSALAEQVAGKIVAVMVPNPGGSTGRSGLPSVCDNSFGAFATSVRAVEVLGGLAVLFFAEQLDKDRPQSLQYVGFENRKLGAIQQQPRISIPVASILHRDLIPILGAQQQKPVALEMKTGAITSAAMTSVQKLFASVLSMTYYNPALDNKLRPPLTPNSERGGWSNLLDKAHSSRSDPCLDHFFGISCNEGVLSLPSAFFDYLHVAPLVRLILCFGRRW